MVTPAGMMISGVGWTVTADSQAASSNVIAKMAAGARFAGSVMADSRDGRAARSGIAGGASNVNIRIVRAPDGLAA